MPDGSTHSADTRRECIMTCHYKPRLEPEPAIHHAKVVLRLSTPDMHHGGCYCRCVLVCSAARKNMKAIWQTACVLSLLACLTGCGTTNQARARRADLCDVLNVTFHTWSLGADVNVGPANVGLFAISGPDGFSYPYNRGITGLSLAPYSGVELGLVIPLHRIDYLPNCEQEWLKGTGGSEIYCEGEDCFERRRNRGYANKYPGWGSIGFDIALGLGVGFRLDVCELVDFIGGCFGLDIMKDDTPAIPREHRVYPFGRETKPKQVPGNMSRKLADPQH
jgi:hypothetical protein